MQKQTTYVGMDVHARTIRVTVLRPNEAQREEWGLRTSRGRWSASPDGSCATHGAPSSRAARRVPRASP